MSGLCGWLGHGAAPDDARALVERMTGTLPGASRRETTRVVEGDAALGVAALHGDPALYAAAGVLAAVAGRPSFADAALAAEAAAHGAAAALARGWSERGSAVLESLRGAYALALLRPAAGQALLAIDLIGGRHPLYYRVADGGLVFGSSGDPVQAHPRGAADPDPQGLFHYVYFRILPGPGTARRDVRRLLPGCHLEFSRGTARLGRHRRLSFEEHETRDLAALERELIETLRAAVGRSAAGGGIGCFLSGGTDSSAVVGLVGDVTGEPARTYSIGFGAEGYDEMEFARAAVERFGARHREYYLTPDDIVEFIPRLARAYSEPMGNESAIAVYHCARMAREDGVTRMLGGDGGDELFAGNSRYSKQRIFDYYHRVPGALRGLLEPLLLGFPGGDRVPPLRKLRSYVRQARMPMPDRLESYNQLQLIGLERILTPEFLSRVDVEGPLALLRETWRDVQAKTLVNRMLGLDWKLTLADNDLPKVSRMCELADVAAEYPLLDDELVELSCRIPPRHKLRGLELRWIWKHALADYLPAKILTKRKHGMGVPFGVWMGEHRRLEEAVLSDLGSLKQRGIVRPEFVDELLRLQREEHASYYGSLVWVLVQLEQWFQSRVDADAAQPGSRPSAATDRQALS